jgi:hypothetical protein
MKSPIITLLLPFIAALMSLTAMGQELKAVAGNRLADVITIPAPEGWSWTEIEWPPSDTAPRVFTCRKEGAYDSIGVQIFSAGAFAGNEGGDSKVTPEFIVGLARVGVERKARSVGAELTLSETLGTDTPAGRMLSFSGRMKKSGKEQHMRAFILMSPRMVMISCVALDEKLLEELSAIVGKSRLVE